MTLRCSVFEAYNPGRGQALNRIICSRYAYQRAASVSRDSPSSPFNTIQPQQPVYHNYIIQSKIKQLELLAGPGGRAA
jgi:hypothetical protein